MKTPDLNVPVRVAQLAQGDSHLRGPGPRLAPDRSVPDRVPTRVRAVISEDQIDLRAGCSEVELEARPVIEVAVETDPDDVPLDRVPAAAPAINLFGFGIEGADGDVDVLVVVKDLDFGFLRGGTAVYRHELLVTARPDPLLPAGVGQRAIDLGRLSHQTLGVVDPLTFGRPRILLVGRRRVLETKRWRSQQNSAPHRPDNRSNPAQSHLAASTRISGRPSHLMDLPE